jgi:transcriptional regulator with XRE-family HTH domain
MNSSEPQRRRTFFKEWRKHRNLTLEVAAQQGGMTAGNLSQLERGTQGYSQTGLEALAEVYDCDPGQLLSQPPVSDAPQVDLPLTRKLLPTFIRQWRKHRGMTLGEVADIVNISHASISRIETGAQPYSQPILEGIAGALDTDPASLLSRDPSDHVAIWSIWDIAQPFERELIVNVATAILKTRKGD